MRTSVRRCLVVVALSALVLSGCTSGKGSRGSGTSTTPTPACPISEQLSSGGTVYYSGTECRGAKLAGAALVEANLSGADLSGADLSGANLSRAQLKTADLTGANLTGATLSDAMLEDTIFAKADLTGANLMRAHAIKTVFADATLVETDLTDADVETADFTGATLKDLRLAEGSYLLWATGLTVESLAAGLGVEVGQLHRAIAAQRLAPVSAETMEYLLKGVCSGTPAPDAMSPAASTATHAFNFVHDRNALGEGAVATPANWGAAALMLAEYVGCLSTKKVELERCSYQSQNLFSPSYATYIRYRQDVTVLIVEAKTGKQLATKVLQGAAPKACPAKVGATGSHIADYGAWPGAAVLAFARPYAGSAPSS